MHNRSWATLMDGERQRLPEAARLREIERQQGVLDDQQDKIVAKLPSLSP